MESNLPEASTKAQRIYEVVENVGIVLWSIAIIVFVYMDPLHVIR